MRSSRRVLLIAAALASGCGGGAHTFLRNKTGIDVSSDVRLCTNGTDNEGSCRPADTGGSKWQRAENFDIFSLQTSDSQGFDTLREIGSRYLATPYWAGHLQLACKSKSGLWFWLTQFSKMVTVSSDYIDLTRDLQREVASSFELEVFATIPVPLDPNAREAFHEKLSQLIASKIDVKLVWFVERFTGGRYAISQVPELTACRNEVDAHAHEGAQLVTGVAGFAVLTNRADPSIADRGVVASALSVLVPNPVPLVEGGLGASWQKSIHRVLRVEANTNQMTPTVYPLWVQLE